MAEDDEDRDVSAATPTSKRSAPKKAANQAKKAAKPARSATSAPAPAAVTPAAPSLAGVPFRIRSVVRRRLPSEKPSRLRIGAGQTGRRSQPAGRSGFDRRSRWRVIELRLEHPDEQLVGRFEPEHLPQHPARRRG